MTDKTAETVQNGPGNQVWLASYPKSGNTWVRAILTALETHQHFFGVNQLGSGAQPYFVGGVHASMGLDPRWSSQDEIDRLRTVQLQQWSDAVAAFQPDATPPAPRLRKTHEVYRRGAAGREPFPLTATRAAILIVRDPRDVACSYAPFFGLDLDASINAMSRGETEAPASPYRNETSQPWGSWSGHATSWLSEDVPFPVHLVRYEDMLIDTVAALLPALQRVGLECSEEQLRKAVEQARFDRLRSSEDEVGFKETSSKTVKFFRKGTSGNWREELSEQQVAVLEADHGPVMDLLGYSRTVDPSSGPILVAEWKREHRDNWLELPKCIGVTAKAAVVPETIPAASMPRPWAQVADSRALLNFVDGSRLLVTDGRLVEVEPGSSGWDPEAGAGIVQGWGVAVALVQQGFLHVTGTVVGVGGRTLLLVGAKGAGRTTTGRALRARGHALHDDGPMLVELSEGRAFPSPHGGDFRLLTANGLTDTLPIPTRRARGGEQIGRCPIDDVVVLAPTDDVDIVTMTEVRGGDAVEALIQQIPLNPVTSIFAGQAEALQRMSRLAGVARVHLLRRPQDRWSVDEVLTELERGRLDP